MAMRRLITICLLALSATAMLVTAPVASGAKRKKPSITRVTPMRISVGGTLTIRGKNFKPQRSRNTVIFRAPSGRSAFVKPRRASRGKLVVVIPAAVSRLLRGELSRPRPTRLKLRVLAGSFSKFTSRRLSPVVTGFGQGDGPGGGGGGGGSLAPCTNGADHDGDMLSNTLESQIGTDPCFSDTDGDGVADGYEYKSAVDLNNDEYQEPNQSLPYPGKRPYPNPLDPSDSNTDFDGDTLSLAIEQRLWLFSTTPGARTLDIPLSYSDGLQHSVYRHEAGQGDRRFPNLPAAGYWKQGEFTSWADAAGYRRNLHVPDPNSPGGYLVRDLFDTNLDGVESPAEGLHYDRDGNGWLADEERDEDADGLTNFDENTGRLQTGWWAECYEQEKPYYVTYAGTDLTDSDSDGDGVRDGADDQDHDDFPNVMELSRIAASGLDDRENGQVCKLNKVTKELLEEEDPPIYWHENDYGRVNPFNPCLPVTSSRSCNNTPIFGAEWAPFDESPNWFALN